MAQARFDEDAVTGGFSIGEERREGEYLHRYNLVAKQCYCVWRYNRKIEVLPI